ncbi:uncharacterized protein BX663DRAFT_552698 [Cokeromyces recurvatus]|uniref:uncharacterized protein n=1 Tax=Cokeromyces recurvatus TaxID=90255 RepID=UPI00222011EB|nr:uncharacterized protein BX663DRAFT_552698 [Cokeromyces recurvatus]KAI7901780.1 hypothetical protein BX663DRAFT_552698 [Cokeromyces recurvatus]
MTTTTKTNSYSLKLMMSEQVSKEEKPIISHCVEHAATGLSTCADCGKKIPLKSLRVAEIYRKNKKVKKMHAKHTWYHFKCWKVPEYLTHVPIEQFRGYPALNEKDKKRIQRVIQGGVGSSWAALMEKDKAEKAEEEMETKPTKTKDDMMDIDLTESLTGIQEEKPKKIKVEKKKKDDDKKRRLSNSKKDILKPKKAKVSKQPASAPSKPKEIILPKEDLLELEKFAKEFSAVKGKK